MNKEMVEIMELKGELKELKTTTEEELTRLSKKIKDNKNDNTKLIESKFEEIMDTVNFTVNNNPNIAKAKGENSNVSANSDADVERIINDRIASYEKGRDEDIGELTSVVEEIADRLVEENKAYVDTNNCPWAEDFIEKNGLGKFLGIYGNSGYCTYPLYEFDLGKLREHLS